LSVEIAILGDMGDVIPPRLRDFARDQAGIVSRRQAIDAGMSAAAIAARTKSGRWRRVHPGVYTTFTGPMTRDAQLWAAVLAAGPGAQLSHQTAAELNRLTDQSLPVIHVTIPPNRRITTPQGVIIHISSSLSGGWRFARGIPPHTFAEETIVDLAHGATELNDVIAYVTAGFAKRKVSEGRIKAVAAARKKLRWRSELDEIADAAAGGAHSVLEYRYDHDVEQAHGLPKAAKQVKFTKPDGSRGYRDRYYEKYKLIVELDGKQFHPPEHKGRDQDRDNEAAATVGSTLRYGWADVTGKRCDSAGQVHAALTKGGYAGPLKPCSPTCTALTGAADRRARTGSKK
jgi:predicted transcriptional regulator of viral defense system